MSDSLSNLILSLTPDDGSTIGNGAMMALLREQVSTLTDDDYAAARDALVDEGLLGRGKGRGGSIFRIIGGDEGDADDTEDDFELTAPEEAAPRQRKARAAGAKASARKSGEPVQVVSYRHGETRVNNPEVGMVHAGTDPDGVKTTWAYDPHLDPALNFDSARAGVEKLIDDALASGDAQAMKDALLELKRMQAPYLTWTGKAERTSFQVDTVSLHVHERVDPATILAAAARRLKGKDAPAQWRQPDLFAAPFENLPLRQALDFYHHEKGWSNRLVSGDSLLVMNSLLTKESMGGRVQMIYIDPPYGIKYGSNFQPFTNKRDVKDRADEDLTQEPEMIKAFRDTWELGIHSYLTYLRDRLVLARDLLHETGSVFVQISDENVHHVREMMDEIFGVENFCLEIVLLKASAQSSKLMPSVGDYLVWYSKDKEKVKYRKQLMDADPFENPSERFICVETPQNELIDLSVKHKLRETPLPDGRILRLWPTFSQSRSQTTDYRYTHRGIDYSPPGNYGWQTPISGLERLARSGKLHPVGKSMRWKVYFDLYPYKSINNVWSDLALLQNSDRRGFTW